MRRPLALATLVAALACLPVPASAGDGTATCTFEYDPRFSPGVSLSPSQGPVTSGGETGLVTCDGLVNGFRVTGPGTLGFEGRYGSDDPDTCQGGGEGDGTAFVTVPTEGGPQHIEDDLEYFYGLVRGGGPIAGKWTGARTVGSFDTKPTKGDCVTAPVTQVHAMGTFTISG